jgi:hypothetical protein
VTKYVLSMPAGPGEAADRAATAYRGLYRAVMLDQRSPVAALAGILMWPGTPAYRAARALGEEMSRQLVTGAAS